MSFKNDMSVAQFYAGKSIFVTSATGFIGKVFLEKLLYSCKDIDKVYVLIREKNGKSVEQRMKELVESEVFIRIKNEIPNALSKIIPINGDICDENLGIQKEHEDFLDKVSLVFHIAASIKFNERLDLSLNSNVEGTRRVIKLCRRMKRLQACVHVSTAFTNTHKKVLEERVYPPPYKLSDVYKFIKENGVDDAEKIKKLLDGRPNTYTFTKALAENVIVEETLDVPVYIIRPSIVSSALKEPVEGWVDTWMGASGLLFSSAAGLNRVIYSRKDNILDVIPVDYVINFMIVAPTRCDSSQKLMVYNCCSSGSNPLLFRDIVEYMKDFCSKTGFNDVPYPSILFTTNAKIECFATFMLQKVPAFVADSLRRIRGKKPRHIATQSKILKNRNLLKFFTAGSWVMKSDGVRSVYSSLNPEDQKTYPCDPALINWRQYIPIYLRGVKRYLLKR